MSETTNALPVTDTTKAPALPVDLPVVDQTVIDPPPPPPPEEPKAEAKSELLLPLVIATPEAAAVPAQAGTQTMVEAKKADEPEPEPDPVTDNAPLQPTPQDPEKDEPPAPPNKMMVVAKALRSIEQNLANIIRLLEEGNGETKMDSGNGSNPFMGLTASLDSSVREVGNGLMQPTDGRVVEGVFDGMQMVGSDGKTYMVPANYASKSKLVEGDMLKLTITSKGSFIYKQIGPIERSRVVASLGFDQTIGEFYATCDNRRWAVLKASVTYFRGEPGDEIVILVPKANPSKWAAVENIIKLDPLAGKM